MALWDDPVVLWDDPGWTWEGLAAVPPDGSCPDPPTPVTADPFYATITSPAWIGDVGVVVEIETFSLPVAATVAVTATRTDMLDCPPPGNPNPFTELLAAIPPGVIFTLDGAAETATFYDKAAKRERGALRYLTPAGSRLIWPTVGGPCRSVCVTVDAGGVPTDGAAVAVSAVLRDT